MPKLIKTFFYMIACSLVFIALVKTYEAPAPSQTASAFDWEKTVDVYFWNDKLSSDPNDCSEVFPLSRSVLNAETLGPGALEALLKGPTQGEKEKWYGTAMPPGVLIQRFEVVNKVAYVDFNENLQKDVAGSCRILALRSQIENTL